MDATASLVMDVKFWPFPIKKTKQLQFPMVQVMPVGIVMAVVEMEGLPLMNPTGPIVWRSGSVRLEKRYLISDTSN